MVAHRALVPELVVAAMSISNFAICEGMELERVASKMSETSPAARGQELPL